MAEKPTAAFVLSLIGGIFILLGAIVVMAIMSAIGSFMVIGGSADILVIYGAVGLIFAIIVLVGAVMVWMKPQQPVACSDLPENDPWPPRLPVTTHPAPTRLRPGRSA